MGEMTVTSLGGDRHRVVVRGHSLVVDQPVHDGGGDSGPTPVELFVASLATCAAHYARRALPKGSPGATVHCTWEMSTSPPWRVTDIVLRVDVPPGTSMQRHAAVLRAISKCTVTNTLRDRPHIVIEVPPPQQSSRPAA